ncbi:MAG: hypothetical protein ACREOD_07490 [Candidatus Dormibacteria bacterium]
MFGARGHRARAARSAVAFLGGLSVTVVLAGCSGLSLGPGHFSLPRVHPSLAAEPTTTFRFQGVVSGTISAPQARLSCSRDGSRVQVEAMSGNSFAEIDISGLAPGASYQYAFPSPPAIPVPSVYFLSGLGSFYAGAPRTGPAPAVLGGAVVNVPPAGSGQVQVNASGRYGRLRLQMAPLFGEGGGAETLEGSWFCP